MPNKITIAQHAGFCFGVKRATDAVEKHINERKPGERILTLGHLIHNQGYNDWLEANGVHSIDVSEIEKICQSTNENSPTTVYIRAHGIPVETEALLQRCKEENVFFDYVDLTCPYVKKIHRIAKENSGEENVFALLGSPVHPEVVGIMSYAEGEKLVFEHANEIEDYLKNQHLLKMHKKTLNLAAQTTQNLVEWEKSLEIVKNYCTNAKFFDTICNVTEIRQNEAKQLAHRFMPRYSAQRTHLFVPSL